MNNLKIRTGKKLIDLSKIQNEFKAILTPKEVLTQYQDKNGYFFDDLSELISAIKYKELATLKNINPHPDMDCHYIPDYVYLDTGIMVENGCCINKIGFRNFLPEDAVTSLNPDEKNQYLSYKKFVKLLEESDLNQSKCNDCQDECNCSCEKSE